MAIPKYDELYNPLLEALRNLGGSASIQEQEDEVAEVLNLSDKELREIHRGYRTKFSYRLAWARNYLKRYGLLENSARGVWVLTPTKGHQTKSVNRGDVNRFVVALDRKGSRDSAPKTKGNESDELGWEEQLLDCVRSMAPDAFERLCQRLLRESGSFRSR